MLESGLDIEANVKDNSQGAFSTLKKNLKEVKGEYREITRDFRHFNRIATAVQAIGMAGNNILSSTAITANLKDTAFDYMKLGFGFAGGELGGRAGALAGSLSRIAVENANRGAVKILASGSKLFGFAISSASLLALRSFIKVAAGTAIRVSTKILGALSGSILPIFGNVVGFIAGEYIGGLVETRIRELLPETPEEREKKAEDARKQQAEWFSKYVTSRFNETTGKAESIVTTSDQLRQRARILTAGMATSTTQEADYIERENLNDEINRRNFWFYNDFESKTQKLNNAIYRLARQ